MELYNLEQTNFYDILRKSVETENIPGMSEEEAIKETLIKNGLDNRFLESEYAMKEACNIVHELLIRKFGEDFDINNIRGRNITEFENTVKSAINNTLQIRACINEEFPRWPKLKKGKKHFFKGEEGRFNQYYRGMYMVSSGEKPYFVKYTAKYIGNVNEIEKDTKGEINYSKDYNAYLMSESITLDGVVFEKREEAREIYDDGKQRTLHEIYAKRDINDPDKLFVTVGVVDKETQLPSQFGVIPRYSIAFNTRNSENVPISKIEIPYSNEQLFGYTKEHSGGEQKELQNRINEGVSDYCKITTDESICNIQKQKTIERILEDDKQKAMEKWAIDGGYCTKQEISRIKAQTKEL